MIQTKDRRMRYCQENKAKSQQERSSAILFKQRPQRTNSSKSEIFETWYQITCPNKETKSKN